MSLTPATDFSEVYEKMGMHYVDDVNTFEGASKDLKSHEMIRRQPNMRKWEDLF